MEVVLTSDQKRLSFAPLRTGGWRSEEDAVREALSL